MLRRALRAVVVVAAGAAGTALCVATPACGPLEYIVNMPLDATGAIAQAKTAKSEKWSPYEHTAMLEYQHKSRELAGYARFHSSVGFARKASANAKKARKLAIERAALPIEQQQDLGLVVSESQQGSGLSTQKPAVAPEGSSEIRAVETKTENNQQPTETPAP